MNSYFEPHYITTKFIFTLNRRVPIGGLAYGIPKNFAICLPPLVVAYCPCTFPRAVFTNGSAPSARDENATKMLTVRRTVISEISRELLVFWKYITVSRPTSLTRVINTEHKRPSLAHSLFAYSVCIGLLSWCFVYI